MAEWIELTDEDRDAVFNSMPNLLEGFMKLWGWLHFAKAIEQKVREKNAALQRPGLALSDEQILDEASHHGFIGSREQLLKFVRGLGVAKPTSGVPGPDGSKQG